MLSHHTHSRQRASNSELELNIKPLKASKDCFCTSFMEVVMSSCASNSSLHKLENIDENSPALSRAAAPETPTESMEFLARSWSVSAVELSKALSNSHVASNNLLNPTSHDHHGCGDTTNSMNLNKCPLQQLPKETSPPISPRGSDEVKELFLLHQALNPDFLSNQQQLLKNGLYKSMVRKRTMRRWVRDQKERKKHEIRTQNAQLHAAVSAAGVAAAVAALAAADASPPSACRKKPPPQPATRATAAAMASAAGLVASHCIEIAEEMGAHRDHILAVVNSAVNARTNGDIMTLTAAAATALRGASILKTRMQKGFGATGFGVSEEKDTDKDKDKESSILSTLNFVSRGGDLLKRTRKGDLHWKQVSFNINSNWQVVAKMKSKFMAGTFTKKKKCVVSGVCFDVPAWPGREKEGLGESRTYFGIKMVDRVIEFECRNKDEKLMWTNGIQNMLNCQANLSMF